MGGALGVAVACGGGQTRASLFSTDWEDDGGVSIGRVWDRIGAAPIPASADVVVGVAGNSDKLIGAPLGGGAKWTFAHPLDARPVIAGNVVVGSGDNEVFALDAAFVAYDDRSLATALFFEELDAAVDLGDDRRLLGPPGLE